MPGNRREGSSMRKILILFPVTFLLLTIPLFAQDGHAPFEIFGGYNFVRLDGDGELGEGINGWNAAFTGNFTPSFGIKAEISGIYKNYKDDDFGDYKVSGHSFMAGPQLSGRFELLPGASSVFGHALFGTMRTGTEYSSVNSFAMAFGGGIDWGKGRVALRAPQLDYFPWRNSGTTINNFRISGGILLRIGD